MMRRGISALVLMWAVLAPLAAHAITGQEFLARAAKASWIAEGQGPRVVYVLFDPNCPYCHVVYTESQAHLSNVQFRWLPVGILTRTSLGKAAALLQAKDPVAALRENEDKFVRARGKLGGIAPATHVDAATSAKLQENYQLLLMTGGQKVVPKIFFLGSDGKVHLIEGALNSQDLSDTLRKVAPSHQ
ncbi:thioredoxin fold domain-containing protein [Acidihalobacter prosperus]